MKLSTHSSEDVLEMRFDDDIKQIEDYTYHNIIRKTMEIITISC